jgi:uncharacterized membrane protein YfcA
MGRFREIRGGRYRLVMKSGEKAFVLMGIGSAGGLLAGLFGVGGGIIMVPLLVIVCGFSQHRAHAMSLTGIVPIAAVGAIAFALQGQVDAGIAGLLAAGSLVGAPLGARILDRTPEARLRIAFGILVLGVAVSLILQ